MSDMVKVKEIEERLEQGYDMYDFPEIEVSLEVMIILYKKQSEQLENLRDTLQSVCEHNNANVITDRGMFEPKTWECVECGFTWNEY